MRFPFAPLVGQVVSVAGDSDAKDINYTKIELAVRDTWRSDFALKFTLKPVIDWQQGGRTAAVIELQGDLEIPRRLACKPDGRNARVGRIDAVDVGAATRAHSRARVLILGPPWQKIARPRIENCICLEVTS
jgi:hypothetical protein